MPTNESSKVRSLANKILTAPKANKHFDAVQAQCAVAVEVYTGILQLAAAQNGLSASALVRTLFETIIGAVVLANHPEKLEDFGNQGKLTLLRLARSIREGSLVNKQITKTLRDVANAEYDTLYAFFKPTKNWHKLTREYAFKEAFEGAPLYETFYDSFYGRTSAIAHGEPFNVFRHLDAEAKTWKIEARYTEWREKWPVLAEVMAMFLLLHLIERVSKAFALGLEAEYAIVNADVGALAGRQMQSARDLPDAK
ncbi:MAG: DUF5677 domain-containing protein [Candidatus Acidiferrales bacterium]